MTAQYQITKARIEGYRALTLTEIQAGAVNQIAGASGIGKSSGLGAVAAVARGIAPDAVREGADHCSITLDLTALEAGAEGVSVTRSRTAAGATSAQVRYSGGATRTAPVAWIEQLTDPGAWNPLALLSGDAASQRAAVLRALRPTLPPDAADKADPPHDGEDGIAYLARRAKVIEARRTQVGRDGKRLVTIAEESARALAALPEVAGAVPVADAQAAAQSAREVRAAAVAEAKAWDDADRGRAGRREELARKRAELAALPEACDMAALAEADRQAGARVEDLERQLEIAQRAAVQTSAALDAARDVERDRGILATRVAELERDTAAPSPRPDTEAPEAAVQAAEAALETARRAEQRAAADRKAAADRAAADASHAEWRALSQELARYREEWPAAMVATATGGTGILSELQIVEGDVLWRKRPLSAASGGERVRIGVALVERLLERSPLRVVCIDGAEALDNARREELFAALCEAKIQVWSSRVDPEGEVRPDELTVRDGQVVTGGAR